MARYTKTRHSNGSLAALVIVSIAVYAYREYSEYMLWGLAAVIALPLLVWLVKYAIRFRSQHVVASDIDTMDGLDFERYIADLLKQHGFRNVSLTEQYDMGVDIVAEKDGQRWGVQVKRYSGLVKAAAVRQVVTALKFYDCDRAMVVTNSTYSNVARQLADSNDCVLIDRPELLKLTG